MKSNVQKKSEQLQVENKEVKVIEEVKMGDVTKTDHDLTKKSS